jgi:L-asparaginase
MQNPSSTVVVLGTGGTIAGTAPRATEYVDYTPAQLSVEHLVQGVSALVSMAVECEQVAQLNSKDMDHATWRELALRCAFHLSRPEVAGIVVTHGTDTLEETAWFLHRVLAPAKPIVLTGAMRPSGALESDGPQNLLDAAVVAHEPGARGVVAVMAGRIHGAREVRKVHPYRIDAFSSGDAGPLGCIEEGQVRCVRPWPAGVALGLQRSCPATLAHEPRGWRRCAMPACGGSWWWQPATARSTANWRPPCARRKPGE